jgi:tetratricopeptide (TPR) repeat protein
MGDSSMTSPAEEFIKKAVEYRENDRLDEAIISARRATALDPQNANSWWQLALAVHDKDGNGAAFAHFKKTTELAPSFAYGWHRLGLAYEKTGQTDEAVHCWERATEIDPERTDALELLLSAYREREKAGDEEKIFDILRLIDAQGILGIDDVNRLGIEYHKRKDYYKSIVYFRRYASEESGPIGFFNLGLAYNATEIGQDADAIDAWRRALLRDPTYDKAKSSIDRSIKPLLDLKNKIKNYGKGLVSEDQWYANYINPYELLALKDVDPWDPDVKQIQKAKKALLQEIDLEDGRIAWMPGLKIDRSMALKIADELNEEWNRVWHSLVFESKTLLDFLSRGKLDHFLVDAEESPTGILDTLEDHPDDFAPWLSKKFAPQYNLLLSEAIQRKDLASVECLLDGRRWVTSEDEDKCFDGAHKQVHRLLLPLKDVADRAERIKPSVAGVEKALEDGSAGAILAALPMAFQTVQSEAASLVRSISVDTYNHHGDGDLAKEILELARAFAIRSPSLRHRLDEDISTLNEKIAEERKNEASLTLSGHDYSIKREGVRFANVSIPTKEIETIRWGISITHSNGIATYAFSMVVGGRGSTVGRLEWTSSKNIETQEGLFNKFVEAAFSYVLPTVMEKLDIELSRASNLQIGPALVSKSGITFTIEGWFNNKLELCPWHRLNAQLKNGDLLIADSSNSKARISIPLKEIDNAFVLYMMIKKQS